VYVRGVRARNNPKEIMEKIYPLFNLTPSERNTPWPELYEQVVRSAIKSLSPESRSQALKLNPQTSPDFARTIVRTLRQALIDAGLSNSAIRLITSLIPEVNAFIQGTFYTEFATEYALSAKSTYRIEGGMVNLPLAFYKSLMSENLQEYNIPKSDLGKVTMKMGSWVTRCYESDKDRKVILKYLTRQTPGGIYESFDYVFFTIPLTALRKIYIYPILDCIYVGYKGS
jgi:monoamine oxidase